MCTLPKSSNTKNSPRAKVYVDPLGRYAIRVDDHEIEFQQKIPMSFQGDRYMDPYVMMVIKIDPISFNKWGMKDND